MQNETPLPQTIARVVGVRKLSVRTWQNLTTTLDQQLLERMVREACASSEQSDQMRQGLANAVLCASGRLEDSLAQAGIECTPRLLMRAAKQDGELLGTLRSLAHGEGNPELIQRVRDAVRAVRRVRSSPKGERASAASIASSTTLRFTPLSQGAPLPVLKCESAGDEACLELSEGEALLLYGVLRGALVAVEIADRHGAGRLRALTTAGQTRVQWLRGRRVAATLLYASAPQALAALVAESLLKTCPTQDQLVRLDKAAIGLAAASQSEETGPAVM